MKIIAVTTDRRPGTLAEGPNGVGRIRPMRAEVYTQEAIVKAVRLGGGEALLVPPVDGDADELVAWLVERVSGVVLTGGAHDIDPGLYGEELVARSDRIDHGRSNLELGLARACWAGGVPCLGVCGGMQAMAVALGGSLFQDIGQQLPEAGEHEQPTDPADAWHSVQLLPGRALDVFGSEIEVNSTHHQAVRDLGALVATGHAPDGVIEVIEGEAHPFFVGVQWHPELLGSGGLYAALVAAG